ncbi:MAG: hypothetical protein CSA18_00980 [Deltaproteobacteria bacterium]|nr:MAG: hypothetical protein CSA18_00980 [Deltaproteobacteria bacterium]
MRIINMIALFGLILSSDALAAEFEYKGKKIKSTKSFQTILCNGYKIILEKDKFPLKYENHVPKEFEIDNFYGSKSIVSANAYKK